MVTKNIYANIYPDTANRLVALKKIFGLWKGSVFKLIWFDLIVFITLYALISGVYRKVLFDIPEAREIFELTCIYASRFSNMIPITFLTGFYVTQVVIRWWDQFMSLPWPEDVALRLVTSCPGKDLFNKNLRRTVMRYINLSTILVYRLVSGKVRKRFPSFSQLLEAKLVLPHEVERLMKADAKTPHECTWLPIMWSLKLLSRARSEGKVTIEAPVFGHMINGINKIESQNRKILNYGWVNFPLAYTQVATVSVFMYFLAALFGRQYLIPQEIAEDKIIFKHTNISYSSTTPFTFHTPDFYFPLFTCVEFLCYMGWIKVAETLLNPFGDDDEDFKINYIIDRNIQVSYLIVDEAEEAMEMAKDPFLEAGIDIPKNLPEYEESGLKIPSRDSVSNFIRVPSKVSINQQDNKGLLKKIRGSVTAIFTDKATISIDEKSDAEEASGLVMDDKTNRKRSMGDNSSHHDLESIHEVENEAEVAFK